MTPRTPQEFGLDLRNIPKHVAVVMDGNGRWANARGLPRTEGHKMGELALMEVIRGALAAGVKVLSVYAFSTENWKRSPAEVRFLMGYSRDVIANRRDELDSLGVRIVWSGRHTRMWKSVVRELERAQAQTSANTSLTLNFCFNYGGRAEIVDAVAKIAQEARDGRINPARITEKSIASHLYWPNLPDVDLLIRSGGEARISNFLLWQVSYAELMFVDAPWPEFTRETLWDCLVSFQQRDRRFGAAVDAVQGSD